ncbi:SIR2 family protein, partial [bacterium]|nr:SIR2 family protein [bacterium]
SKNKNRVQNLEGIYSNGDKLEDKIVTSNSVPFIKLHGCITITDDPNLPLILTTDQYVTHRKNRENLFNLLSGWGHDYPILFVGHKMRDFNLRIILNELVALGEYRPRYYIINPSLSDEEVSLWESRRISILKGSFKEFLDSIDTLIEPNFRPLLRLFSYYHPIQTRFASTRDLSKECYDFLKYEADFVYSGMPIEYSGSDPKHFYKGNNLDWFPIEQDLDVRRNLTDKILVNNVLLDESDRPTKCELYVIKAEAGAGKSVLLRRIAWDASQIGEKICIYIKEHGKMKFEVIYELVRNLNQRVFLFIDNAPDNVSELEYLIMESRKNQLPLTIFSAARINEWNMACDRLEPLMSGDYRLTYLSKKEIENLLILLDKHGSLGYLENHSHEFRVTEFEKRAGRQLLVALHEATLGKSFEEILVDEFNEIRPSIAQSIYRSVCVLNRFKIFVRAGLISRVYGIPFSEFKRRLFAPLEHVVKVSSKSDHMDYLYSARHSHIAGIIFDRLLADPEDKFTEYIKLLDAMNVSYSTDRDAFRRLIRGRALTEYFPEKEAVEQIFKVAERISPQDSFVYHQRAIYELKRRDGNLNEAYGYLKKARKLAPNDFTITHSLSELALIRSEQSKSMYEKELYRNDSIKLAQSLLQDRRSSEFGRHTLLKIYIDQLAEILKEDSSTESEIDEHISKIEQSISNGLQEHPGASYLHSAESDFRRLLSDEDRAIIAMKKALGANKRNAYLAGRLAKLYYLRGSLEDAINVLSEAIDSHPTNKTIRYQYAMMYREYQPKDVPTIIYHLQRSFSKWDHNFAAQLWYARYCFVYGDTEKLSESKVIFRNLREAPIHSRVRYDVIGIIMEDAEKMVFSGTIVRKFENYGFIERDGKRDQIYFRKSNAREIWFELKSGDRVTFKIGFTFNGPICLDVII